MLLPGDLFRSVGETFFSLLAFYLLRGEIGSEFFSLVAVFIEGDSTFL